MRFVAAKSEEQQTVLGLHRLHAQGVVLRKIVFVCQAPMLGVSGV